MHIFWKSLLKPKAWVAKLLLVLLVGLLFLLSHLNYLHPLKEFLDSESLSLNVGEMRFSVYLLSKALLTLVVLFWLAGIFSEFGEKRIKALHNLQASNKTLITKIFQIVVYFIALIITLNVLDIDLTGLAIFSGAIGIGIGVGLQKIASNFISGLILLFEKSIEEGDLVELNNGITGFVRYTSARYTLIETFDSKEVMIPNEDFITNRVTNCTYSTNQGRIEINVGVSYNSDLDKVSELLLKAANNHPRCSKKPQAECFIDGFGESSINFTLFFWVDDVTEGCKRPKSDVLLFIWKEFKENNIEIPFPQHDLHIKAYSD